tara:strand:+ start:3807 stop:4037 length:231 start_codon:yes stop_codon:yes gene_type:complete
MSGIQITGKQIRHLAEFTLGISIDTGDYDEQQFCIETNVPVDGAIEDFYVYDTEYPEEGGTTLNSAEVVIKPTNEG